MSQKDDVRRTVVLSRLVVTIKLISPVQNACQDFTTVPYPPSSSIILSLICSCSTGPVHWTHGPRIEC